MMIRRRKQTWIGIFYGRRTKDTENWKNIAEAFIKKQKKRQFYRSPIALKWSNITRKKSKSKIR